jgi:Retrotransposon gag protein
MDPMQAIANLQAQVAQLQSEVQILRSISTPSRPKPSLPDPEKFNGQSHKFDTWLPSIKAKLRVDGAAIGDSVAQFYYVFLNLESHVQAMVLPQLGQAEESNMWDYTTILNQLARVHDNPNKVQEAEDKLLSLRQSTDSVLAYISKFERVLYEARGQDWPDINKISIFRNGLNSTIRGRLNQQLNLPTNYPGFVRTVQQLAGRSTSSSSSLVHPQSNGNNQRGAEPMDVNTITLNSINLSKPRSPSSTSSAGRARSISPARREQYRSQGRCVRCGSHDHWVGSCSLQPYRKQIVRRTLPVESDDEMDSDWEAELSRLPRREA